MLSEESANPPLRSIDAIREFHVVDPLESAGWHRRLSKIESSEAGKGRRFAPNPMAWRVGERILDGLFLECRSMLTMWAMNRELTLRDTPFPSGGSVDRGDTGVDGSR